AAALDAGSLHPAAQALVRAAPPPAARPAVRELREAPGGGVAARVELGGRWVDARLGSPRFALGGAEPPAAIEPGAIVLALDGRAAAAFVLSEELRPDAAAALERLRDDGLRLAILSGDAPPRVAAVAAR